MKESQLIFIVSQPRSGSTFLQNVLSNNSHINTTSEPWILLNYANQLKSSLVKGEFDNQKAKEALDEYLLKYQELDYRQEFKKFLLKLYEPMLEGKFSYVIDKTPRYWELIDELKDLFPESKVIVLKRNPVNVLQSMIKTWHINDLERLTYLKRDILYAPRALHNFCMKNRSNENVYEVKYEDLIEKQHSEVEKIYHWLGVKFDASYLNTKTNNKFKGVFGDPYQNKVLKKNAKRSLFDENLDSFIKGYVNYLTNDFLYWYGKYPSQKLEITPVFYNF